MANARTPGPWRIENGVLLSGVFNTGSNQISPQQQELEAPVSIKRRHDAAARLYRVAREFLVAEAREVRRQRANGVFPAMWADVSRGLQQRMVTLRENFAESEPGRVAEEHIDRAYYKAMEPYEDGILTPNGREVW